MNAVLVAGCGLGGAVVGALLDTFAARYPLEGAEGSEEASAALLGATTPAPVAPAMPAPATAAPAPVTLSAAVPEVRSQSPRPMPAVGISVRVERVGASVATAALLSVGAARLGATPVLAAYSALFAGLVLISVVDLRAWIVPRRLLYPLWAVVAVGLVAASAADHRWHALANAAIGGAVAFGVLFAVWWAFPRGMGFGDVRLAGLVGTALGWLGLVHLYVGFLTAFLAGAVFGVVLMVARGTGRKTRLPFAPALSAGAVIGVLWGAAIIGAWFPGHT